MTWLLLIVVSAGPALELVPMPQHVVMDGKKTFPLLRGTPVVVADDAEAEYAAALAVLSEAAGFDMPVRCASMHPRNEPAIHIGEWGRHAGFDELRAGPFRPGKEGIPRGGYRLVIAPSAVMVAGGDRSGTVFGIQTLAQMVRGNAALPCVQIDDHADLAWRGVLLREPPPRDTLRRLAALKCNLVVFDTIDFYRIEGGARDAWRGVFEDARALGLEPVPLIDPMANAMPLLDRVPAMAEGRRAEDRITLTGDDWMSLSQRNLIVTPATPIHVRVSGFLCREKDDYALEPGSLDAPFDADEAPWIIRRIPGGAIPDGATVSVIYTFVPPGTATYCPSANESRKALSELLRDLVKTLEPRFIHIGHGDVPRLNACPRCTVQDRSNAHVFAASVAMLDEVVKACSPDIRLMMWADAVNPYQDAHRYDLSEAGALLPPDVILMPRIAMLRGAHKAIRESVAWADGLGLDVIGVAGDTPATGFAWCDALQTAGRYHAGVLFSGDDRSDKAITVLMEKAWSRLWPRSLWGEFLNEYLGADRWSPEFDEARAALIEYVNGQTLAGVAPETHYDGFRRAAKTFLKRAPELNDEMRLIDAVYAHLVDYLEIESEFTENREDAVLQRLNALVKRHGELDPAADQARIGTIVETVSTKGLFVPSTILFGNYLLPYRPLNLPAGYRVLEVPCVPAYTDTEDRATAVIDFLDGFAPMCRVDFETTGTARLDVAHSDDGFDFASIGMWTSDQRGGVQGPAIITAPSPARFLRVEAYAPAERAVLRNVRVFALKSLPLITCSHARAVPKDADGFSQIAWADTGRASGFLRVDTNAFASAPTSIRLLQTREALVIGVEAFEPRLATMVADLADRDAPLWQEESVELFIDTGDGEPFHLAVSPRGVQSDARGHDAGWDGDWRVVASVGDGQWVAVLTVPFGTLGGAPAKGDVWPVNFIRNRANIHAERSAWSGGDTPDVPDHFGTLRFE